MLALYAAVLFFIPVAIAQEWLSDPRANLRPINITGLPYYIYRWTGSYYNGSTTIRIEPKEFEDDTDKDTRLTQPIEITYENSILAIVKSNRFVKDQNELTFSLRYWDKQLNITPVHDDADGPINSIRNIDSVDMNRYYRPSGTLPPYWQLDSTHGSGTSYSFGGQRNSTVLQSLRFNCSQCLSSNEFGGSIVNPPKRRGADNPLNVTSFPSVSGQFNNRSASLRISGTFVGGDRPPGDGRSEVHLGGPITISFLGELDELRSDVLLPSRNGTPLWNSTLGYKRQLYGNAATAMASAKGAFCACIVTALVAAFGSINLYSMNITDREQNAFLALLNGQAGRYEATKRYIKTIIESGIEPSDEEQKLLSVAYSKLQHGLRASWRAMSAVEEDQRASNGKHLGLIEEARRGVEAELEELCDEVIDLVDKHIYPSATTDETLLFCLKMFDIYLTNAKGPPQNANFCDRRGDYNRYSAECTSEEKRIVRTELAASAYGIRFDAGSSLRMSIIVNAAVFYYDIMGMHEGAIELTETELSKAAEALGNSVGEDIKAIMGLLQANLRLWRADQSR
ncbi:14-3-3 domain protein [Cordyceps fumosorosea ARSEF 2679]|uniref:14-3-3 domain protein n=1 Tax=Cordyceps fumosorosea (strain ARSEF 2679) TaxID=1081104 RepID=A0A168E4C4_CORFA|nr:14-3-3 domain protein [Cordyceps fumosorosea ARSEF 2679]OAA73360.1 14-3-3 domain protein [Cordyceps fumosorosea ARSEF 2679]